MRRDCLSIIYRGIHVEHSCVLSMLRLIVGIELEEIDYSHNEAS